MILSDGGLITAAQLGVTPAAGRAQTPASQPAAASARDEGGGAAMQALPEMEKQAVVEALRRAKGNKSLLRRYGLS